MRNKLNRLLFMGMPYKPIDRAELTTYKIYRYLNTVWNGDHSLRKALDDLIRLKEGIDGIRRFTCSSHERTR